jgi:cellulose synthase/poly-beta-1,6-N-acetylglucosamine synthase-like glycosyltransferase
MESRGARETTPSVSVIIPTYSMDRWQQMREAVASAQAQTVPALEVIVVVDHNPELLDRVKREIPSVVAVPNVSARGVSGARNCGVKASRGEIVAFLDDDAVADAAWLATLLPHIAEPNVIGTGCRVNGLWEKSRPAWFPEEFSWLIGVSYRGMPTARPVEVRNVWTCSMLVKKSSFQLVDGFRADFGKVGNRPLPEDTDLCIRISSADEKGKWIYEPESLMLHRVPAVRLKFSYFVKSCFYQGWGKAAMAAKDGFDRSTSSERGYATRTLPAGVARGLADLARGDLAGALRSASIVAGLSAAVAGYAWFAREGIRS